MRTIQDVGIEIMEGHPAKFYIFAGSEYGIKMKYISEIASSYSSPPIEAESVNDVINLMTTRHLIPLKPSVYIVRYDEDFLSSLSDKTESELSRIKIEGTIVCLYEQSKHIQKLEKYLPNELVIINPVSPKFVNMYLHKEFTGLPDKLIDSAVHMSNDYGNARNIARLMTYAPVEDLYKLEDSELVALFGSSSQSSDTNIKCGVAARNFKYLIELLEMYPDSLDNVVYAVLSAMVELEKISKSKYIESDLRQFSDRWKMKDIFNMFMNAYHVLELSRKYPTDMINHVLYLFSLLQFSEIPSVEDLEV